ncbi:uncharacterized protein LOC131583710 [Poecile atricapillus]|uniref:uncharacterized protein LOC131583710 n=1 Tax=Poecile atricapillus TaxID=48891 RepID=UPI00273962B6|nr:uncharacterized protein LOC131583710 [Poecile atricapillus]
MELPGFSGEPVSVPRQPGAEPGAERPGRPPGGAGKNGQTEKGMSAKFMYKRQRLKSEKETEESCHQEGTAFPNRLPHIPPLNLSETPTRAEPCLFQKPSCLDSAGNLLPKVSRDIETHFKDVITHTFTHRIACKTLARIFRLGDKRTKGQRDKRSRRCGGAAVTLPTRNLFCSSSSSPAPLLPLPLSRPLRARHALPLLPGDSLPPSPSQGIRFPQPLPGDSLPPRSAAVSSPPGSLRPGCGSAWPGPGRCRRLLCGFPGPSSAARCLLQRGKPDPGKEKVPGGVAAGDLAKSAESGRKSRSYSGAEGKCSARPLHLHQTREDTCSHL